MTTGAAREGTWQKLARMVAACWEGPLPRRPATRDPREIDAFYARRYAPRKARRAATSQTGETT